MALEVRPCRPEEQLAGLTPIFHYFGAPPKEEYVQRFARLQPPERLHAAFEDGKAVGGVQTVSVKKGDRARFKVVSDADHEIHLHGFDIAKDVKAGGSVTYNVKTDAPGIYEFEIEDTKTKIGQVKVEP